MFHMKIHILTLLSVLLLIASCKEFNANQMQILFNTAAVAELPVVYVNLSAPGPSHDGKSWNSAFLTLQDAIDSSTTEIEIWVAQGTYYTYVSSKTDSINLRDNISVYGGFDGTESSREERDWSSNTTTLCGGDGPGLVNRVYHVVNGANYTLLDGFTVCHGHADGFSPDAGSKFVRAGAGMYNAGVSPTISNCIFRDNEAGNNGVPPVPTDRGDGYGGAIYNLNNAAIISNCFFYNNISNYYGGAVYSQYFSGKLRIQNSIFTNNSGLYGSAVVNDFDGDGTEIINCTFTGNNEGGLTAIGTIYTRTAPLVVKNSIFWNNLYNAINGTIYNSGGTSSVTVTYSNMEDGIAGTGNLNNINPNFIGGLISSPYYVELNGTSATNQCIDSGNLSLAPAYDFEGVTRPTGSGVDMGAFEK